jgi:hypothetical protein
LELVDPLFHLTDSDTTEPKARERGKYFGRNMKNQKRN